MQSGEAEGVGRGHDLEPGARPEPLALSVTWSLIAMSTAISIGMAFAHVPVVFGSPLLLGAAGLALAALRWWEAKQRPASHGDPRFFWLNLALSAAAIWLSPIFGLYLFVGYYEASSLPTKRQRIAGIIGTALVISVAQLGGPRSEIALPLVWLAFVAINLGIAGLMLWLDQRREQLLRELSAANQALRDEQAQSARLRDQLVAQAREAGVAEERERLSREIHDTVAQDLVAIIAQLDAATTAADEAERQHRLELVDSAARGALAEARRAVGALNSPRLDEESLPLALDDMFGQWRALTGLDGELQVLGKAVPSPADPELLRVAQEALANVAKHARASRVEMILKYAAALTLTVHDDGVGFDTEATHSGFGLTNMRARLAAAGGLLTITSDAGGTTVQATVPGSEES